MRGKGGGGRGKMLSWYGTCCSPSRCAFSSCDSCSNNLPNEHQEVLGKGSSRGGCASRMHFRNIGMMDFWGCWAASASCIHRRSWMKQGCCSQMPVFERSSSRKPPCNNFSFSGRTPAISLISCSKDRKRSLLFMQAFDPLADCWGRGLQMTRRALCGISFSVKCLNRFSSLCVFKVRLHWRERLYPGDVSVLLKNWVLVEKRAIFKQLLDLRL